MAAGDHYGILCEEDNGIPLTTLLKNSKETERGLGMSWHGPSDRMSEICFYYCDTQSS